LLKPAKGVLTGSSKPKLVMKPITAAIKNLSLKNPYRNSNPIKPNGNFF
jgi:hypothetical protein